MTIDFDFPEVTDQESYSPLEDGTYLFKVADLVDPGISDYGNPRVQWITNVAEQVNGKWVGVNNEDGSPYEKWIFSNLPKNGQAMSPQNETRKMIEAILGRKLEDGEKPSPALLIGQRFTAQLGPYRRKSDQKLTQILNKDSIRAFVVKSKAPPAPVPETEDDSEEAF